MPDTDSTSPQPSVLLLVASALSLVAGYLSLVYPHQFAGPPAPVALRQLNLELSRLTVVFLASGTCGLLAFAVKARRDSRLALGLAALATLPFLAALVNAARTRVWLGVALGGAFAIGLLLDVARPWHRVGHPRRLSALAGVGLATALAFAGLGLTVPNAFGWPPGTWPADALPYLIGGMGAAAALLAAGAVLARPRFVAHAAAALPFLALAAGAGTVGRWVGVVTYGMLGVGLALEPWLLGLLQRRIQHREAQSQSVTVFEFATEGVAWGFTLLVALVALLTDDAGRLSWLGAVVVVNSLFTAAWYHLMPARGSIHRTVFAATVYSALTTAFVWLTGGVHSPYFFLVPLPILTLAWTHAPRTIIVPAVVPAVVTLAEVVLAARGGVPALGTAAISGVPRLVGLLLIAGLAYFLATRNLQGRRKVEEAHRQLATVLAHMAEGLVCTDPAGRIQLCNPAAAALVGRAPEDVHGIPVTVALPLRHLDGTPLAPAAHPVRRALGGQAVPWLRVQLATTPPLPVAVTATPLCDDGQIRGAVVLLRDARVEVEMERMREDFFFIASHELRTPLTVMKGNLEMALDADPPDAVRATVEDALASTTRLIRMVNAFLDAARLEHGALTLRVEDGDLGLLVQQAIDTLRPEAERKGLAITYVPPAALPPVRMDAERTLQILVNLIGNGIRYTTRGGVEITHAVEDHVVETCVRDTGAGIAPDQHERLFTRFGQLQRGLTRTTGGSGLGLYISRKLAEQMGGTVLLKESTVGRGSTFALRLPVAAVPAASR